MALWLQLLGVMIETRRRHPNSRFQIHQVAIALSEPVDVFLYGASSQSVLAVLPMESQMKVTPGLKRKCGGGRV
jgi:hypothetical protein